jgi:hypothetical protein
LNLTDAGRRAVLEEVTARLLARSSDIRKAPRNAILGHVQAAVASALAEGCADCTLRRLPQGQLNVVISHQDGREWRTTRPLP